MPDILLIQPPIRDFYLTAKRTVPCGLAAIAAVLRKAGFSVQICDGLATSKSRIIPWPEQMEDLAPYYGRWDGAPFALFHHYRHYGYSIIHIAAQAKAAGAFLIGISSLFSAYSDVALETAAAVKKACPQVPIVLGGHHPTALPESVIAHPAVDYVLRGDGEVGLVALARALQSKSPLKNVPGLVRKTSDGTTIIRPPALAPDLDALPTPALDLISWRHYQRAGLGSMALTATRGCPLRCTYCAVNSKTYHGFRRRSVESVMAEIKHAFDVHPMGFIDFEDEHLCADKPWVQALMIEIARRFGHRRPELRAMNGLYAPNLDDTILDHLRRAGFRQLNLALISTAPSHLRRFARPDMTAEVDRVLHAAPDRGLGCVVYIIVAGPDQDPYLSVDDLIFLAGRRTLAGVSVFYPAPGSIDFDWCRRHHLLAQDPALWRATALPLSQRTDRTQTVTLLRLGRVLNFIKALADRGEALPLAAKAPLSLGSGMDRVTMGKRLLSAFFNDGVIRGVDEKGFVYRHIQDSALTMRFIRALRNIAVKGAAP